MLLRRLAETLPTDLLRRIVSYVPTFEQSCARSGIRVFLERHILIGADGRLGIYEDNTVVVFTSRYLARKDHERRKCVFLEDSRTDRFRDHELASFRDYWYGVSCVVYGISADANCWGVDAAESVAFRPILYLNQINNWGRTDVITAGARKTFRFRYRQHEKHRLFNVRDIGAFREHLSALI